MDRRRFFASLVAAPLAASVPTSPKRHAVVRIYFPETGNGQLYGPGGRTTTLYYPEDYHAQDLDIKTEELTGPLASGDYMLTILLADGKPVDEFIYWRDEQTFIRQEQKDEG